MLKCSEVSRLSSEALERDLGVSEKIGLGLHLMMCSGCRNFTRQMRSLRTLARAYRDGAGDEGRSPEKPE